jgi:hypothetical protein
MNADFDFRRLEFESIRFPSPETEPDRPAPRRLYLHEPGWQIGLKVGSVREFCYMMAPGQDYYHRLSDGEVFLYRNDERICVACAERRGLLSFEPKSLREPVLPPDFESLDGPPEIEIGPPR